MMSKKQLLIAGFSFLIFGGITSYLSILNHGLFEFPFSTMKCMGGALIGICFLVRAITR